MSFTVLVTAPALAAAGHDLLVHAGCRVLFLSSRDPQAEMRKILETQPVDAIIARTLPLTADVIASSVQLKVICKHGTGVDNIDVAAATRRGIPVYATPGANAKSVTEMTLGLMLAAARRIPDLDRQVRDGGWPRGGGGVELNGKTLGLVGLGQIGVRVARVGLGLGMRVVGLDPARKSAAGLPEGLSLASSLDALLRESDVLSLHAPLNEHTRGMIGAAQLAALPAGAILVNTARGELVDEPALIAALERGHLWGAGLDATASEPPLPGNPLLSMRQVVLTPHVGGSTGAALSAMAQTAALAALAVLRGESVDPASCVNREVLAPASSGVAS